MDYHLKSCDETFQSLQSSKDGLSSSEAAKRLEQYGPNKLNEAKKKYANKIENVSRFKGLTRSLALIPFSTLPVGL